MYVSYVEEGGNLKAYMCVEEGEGEGRPKTRIKLRKYFIEDPSW